MKDAIKDLSTLTTIPYHTLKGLMDRLINIIAYDIKESKIDEEAYCEIDLYIGTLIISILDEEVKFKFIPSNKLTSETVDALTDGDFKLIEEVENSLRKKIINTYKDLF